MGFGNRRQSWLAVVLLASVAVWIGTSARADEVKRYDNHKVIQIDLKTQDDLDTVRASGAVILDCRPGLKPTQVIASPEQLRELEQLGRRIEILHENAQAIIDAQKRVVPRADVFDDFFLDYHPWGDASTSGTIVWYMNELLTRYPTSVSMLTVGSTLEARHILALRITNDMIVDKPGVIYFCDQHAREWITPTACLYFSNYLLENYGTDPLVTDLVDNVEIFIIPVVNVDGYIYTWTTDRWWRKNRRNNGGGSWGVDINRNWGHSWGWDDLGSSPYPDDETYRGTGPFSEPETQAMRDFFIAHPNVRAMLDIHSYSQLILWPWGYIPDLPPDQDVYADIGYTMQSLIYDVHGKTYAAGPGYSTIYPTNGDSTDWTYGDQGVLSFTYELRPTGYPYFELPPEEIIPNNEEITPANLYLTNSDWVRAAMRYRFPAGLPGTLTAGSDTTIAVDIIGQTEAITVGTEWMYYRYDPSEPYIEVPLTSLGGDSYEVVLPATNCTSIPQYYFTATGDDGTTETSPKNAPTEGVYTALVVTGASSFYSQDLSTNPGWSVQGQWAYGQPTGGGGEYGGPDPTSGHTGPNVYGYNLSGDYANNLPERHLTSAAIDCTNKQGVQLLFWRWLGVEQPAYDHAYVRVSNNGTDWVTVWANMEEITDSSWMLQSADISAVADNQPNVYLRWTMGPTDSGWRYCGWNIDDIELTEAMCEAVPGDYDGDGDVDEDDLEAFGLCFTGPGGGVNPACRIFDFDADNDVDCDDWEIFKVMWTGGPEPPTFPPCEAFAAPTPDEILKNRYLSFTVGPSMGLPQALRVTTVSDPVFPSMEGEQKWVSAPDAEGRSHLVCNPVFMDWEMAYVDLGDKDVVPGATYAIEATLDGVDFLAPVSLLTVPLWGDLVNDFIDGAWTPSNGVVDFRDITAMVDRFKNLPVAPPMAWCDMQPAYPDGVVDFADIMYVVDAFRGNSYLLDAPTPCE